jgi:hypothetical protein
MAKSQIIWRIAYPPDLGVGFYVIASSKDPVIDSRRGSFGASEHHSLAHHQAQDSFVTEA